MIKHFKLNTEGRDFFVGDIHGCTEELREQEFRVRFNPTIDRIFSVGDLVDRGEHSLQCSELPLLDYFHAVQGNHENMAIRYPSGNMSTDNYGRNGGTWMIDLPPKKQFEVSEQLKKLPLMIEVETKYGLIGVVHAEVYGGDWNYCKENIHRRQVKQQVLWNRDKISFEDRSYVSGIDYVVVGHTPLTKPTRMGNVFYIDTGAVFGKRLTFITIEELIKGVL